MTDKKKNNNYLWIGIAVIVVVVFTIVLISNSNNNSTQENTEKILWEILPVGVDSNFWQNHEIEEVMFNVKSKFGQYDTDGKMTTYGSSLLECEEEFDSQGYPVSNYRISDSDFPARFCYMRTVWAEDFECVDEDGDGSTPCHYATTIECTCYYATEI